MKEMPRICLIGHGENSLKIRSKELTLPFGEVNNAKKLHAVLKDGGIPVSDVWDIYELFEIEDMNDENGELFLEMLRTNITLATSGIDFITDFNNQLAKTFRQNVFKKAQDSKKNVLLFLSWAGKGLSMLSTGIQNHFPVIGKEDSFIKATQLLEPFPMKKFSEEVDLLISESLLGAANCKLYDIPLHKFLYLPNLAPKESSTLRNRSANEKKAYRESYLKDLGKRNEKKLTISEKTLVIGCPSRFVRRKNIDILIYAVSELYKKYPHIVFVLKGDLDSEFDVFSLYSEKLNQLLLAVKDEPWFLWDRSHTPYPEVLKIYGTFDLALLLSGAELGSNTVVEVASLGIPTLVLNASVNPYLYKGISVFVEGEKPCNAPWIYQQPNLSDLMLKLEDLIIDETMRKCMSNNSQSLSEERFGHHQLLERIPLAAHAAWSFFNEDVDVKKFQDTLLSQLENDINEYQVQKEF